MRNLFLASLFLSVTLNASLFPHASAVLSARPVQETMDFSLEGKITQHKGNHLTVNTQGNIVFRVVYSETTSIVRKDDEAGTPKDLNVGTRVFIEGDLTESGEIIARKISIRPDAASN